jgi:hypothetical protein
VGGGRRGSLGRDAARSERAELGDKFPWGRGRWAVQEEELRSNDCNGRGLGEGVTEGGRALKGS